MNRSPLRAFVLIPAALACFALSPLAWAVDPPPDGGYPNFNTAEGEDALFSLTTGSNNTGIGFNALFNNTSGSDNTATGTVALYSNTTGSSNTVNGDSALFYNTSGAQNTAIGFQALLFNRTGNDNTANGVLALAYNATGSNNIALGTSAGINLTTGSDNIYIGNPGNHGESGKIRIGTVGTQTATFLAGISGVTVPDGVGVIVGSSGKLGTIVSSARFKDEIKPMDKASEAILALKPVTFRYKHELDPAGVPQFGLVAEEVAKVNPALVARDKQGKPYTVRYEAVNAMLLNEFLKEHRKIETLEARMVEQDKDYQANACRQQREIDSLKAALNEQAAEIQKVSAQLEASKPAPQVVLNNH
jgi:Chaperone of endosialidase